MHFLSKKQPVIFFKSIHHQQTCKTNFKLVHRRCADRKRPAPSQTVDLEVSSASLLGKDGKRWLQSPPSDLSTRGTVHTIIIYWYVYIYMYIIVYIYIYWLNQSLFPCLHLQCRATIPINLSPWWTYISYGFIWLITYISWFQSDLINPKKSHEITIKWLFRNVRITMEPSLQQSQATWSPPAWDLRRNDGWQICPGSFCPRTRTWATWCFSRLLYWKGGQWKVHLERGIIWIKWWYLKYECMSNLIEPWYLWKQFISTKDI